MKFIFLAVVLSVFGTAKETICLNMIVKDERPVILKCLESVKPLIDYWVIVDTGSTDGTQKAIREFMKDIPGELHERGWVNFAHNRNEALELAKNKGDYCLLIDADEVLTYPKSFRMPKLKDDLYAITIRFMQTDGSFNETPRAFLIKKEFPCKWKGVIHETIETDAPCSKGHVADICINTGVHSGGNRSKDPNKYLKDALTLKKALEEDPQNARYQFYLGATYEMAGRMDLALEAFEKCSKMEGADKEERFRSLFQVGVLQERLGRPASQFLASYEKSFDYAPHRAEPLFFMANYYVRVNDFKKAYDLLKKAVVLPMPTDGSFVEGAVYSWASLYNLSICTENLGKTRETSEILEKLIVNPQIPQNFREVAEEKLKSFKKKNTL